MAKHYLENIVVDIVIITFLAITTQAAVITAIPTTGSTR